MPKRHHSILFSIAIAAAAICWFISAALDAGPPDVLPAGQYRVVDEAGEERGTFDTLGEAVIASQPGWRVFLGKWCVMHVPASHFYAPKRGAYGVEHA
jgi:hypothetical protein